MSSVTIPRLAMTYVVVWDHLRIIKVGRAWKMSRLRRLTNTGARVIMLWRDSPAGFERYALRELAQHFPKAFANAEESKVALPGQGRGWTECFRVTAENVRDAMRSIFRGVARYERDQKAAERATVDVQRRGADGAAARGQDDRTGAALLRRRRGPRVSEPGPDQGEPVAARRDDHTVLDRGAPGGPRGRRLHPPIHPRRPHLPRPGRVAIHRPGPTIPTPSPTTTRPDTPRDGSASLSRGPREGVGRPPRGSGGEERGRGRRRQGEGGRWRWWAEGGARTSAHWRTVTLLLQAPALRDREAMRWVCCSPHQAPDVAEGPVRRRHQRPRRASQLMVPVAGADR